MGVSMGNNTCLIETIATLIHDNVANLIIIVIAQTQFDISLMTSLKLWFIAQCLNVSFSYSRRMFFHTYNEQILGFFSRYASQK
jgi:hypothetical protein